MECKKALSKALTEIKHMPAFMPEAQQLKEIAKSALEKAEGFESQDDAERELLTLYKGNYSISIADLIHDESKAMVEVASKALQVVGI